MNHYTNTYTLCVHSHCVTQYVPKSKRPKKKIKIPSFIIKLLLVIESSKLTAYYMSNIAAFHDYAHYEERAAQ